jgi:hypothetical protein
VIRWIVVTLLLIAGIIALSRYLASAGPDVLPPRVSAAPVDRCGPGLAAEDLAGTCRRLGPCRNDPDQLCTTMGALEAIESVPKVKGLRIRPLPKPNTK